MKKLFLASAVSALFAAPATVLAGQPPATPTLDKVLEASGISVNGYIDAGYTYANKNIESGFSTRVFDSQNNSFALHQFGLTVAKQPKEGFGGLVNVTVGKDAQALHSYPEGNSAVLPTNSTSMFDVTQGYAQYAGGPVTVIAGKFVTLHGMEVIASPGNANISRSILFGSVPFTHTGLRATFALGDTVNLIAGVNNGWDQLTDSNKGKTVELGATIAPIKPLSIAVSAYSGKETLPQSTPGNPEGNRTSVNAVVSYAIIDPLSVGVELLQVTQKEFPSTSGTVSAKYSGAAFYVTYAFIPKLKGTVRVETFTDKDGLRFALPSDTSDPNASPAKKFMEGTVTVAYLPSDAFELRAEVRQDQADNKAFVDSKGVFSKTLMTMALQGLYKF
jgi:hypothetical protein